ncbi:dienelactone hydrolase [Dactylonectria macrodidyma]|uniref:Dienelactone hydrolase n=1 Tax=Dactylonectria macrodidyma TaxID=307937 RepID=A0A9P9ELJ4_9HYPO|nr:dienelactone hydrolase [Dactylonectria macrodidyma]
MASRPSAECCTTGFKHEYSPLSLTKMPSYLCKPPAPRANYSISYRGVIRGQSTKVASIWDAYVATPPPDKRRSDVALLYIPDVIGIWENSKLTANELAENGYVRMVIDRHRSEQILRRTGQPFQICLYSNVAHGFAVRGGLSQREQRFVKEQAFRQAI